jgi:hypothetical protein
MYFVLEISEKFQDKEWDEMSKQTKGGIDMNNIGE